MKELIHKLKEKSVGVDASVRPFFREISKENKGITLIALIITIIVMLILVGVTVSYTVGENGILNSTKEAKFKQEVTHIIEAVEIEKKAVLVENKGETPDPYDIVRLQNAIPNSLKTKYLESGKLSIAADGNLYYNEANLDKYEKQWLEELGITAANAGEKPFVNDFEITLSKETVSYDNTKVRIRIKPNITNQWNMPEKFTEEISVPIVAAVFEYDSMIDSADNITTLDQLCVAMYNKLITIVDPSNPLGGIGLSSATVFYSKDKTTQGDVSVQESLGAVDASYSAITPQEFFIISYGNGKTVEEYAAEEYRYTPINYSMKIAKGVEGFVDVTEQVNWNGLINTGATYEVTTNGTYTIQLELEGKKSRDTVEVTEIYVEPTDEEKVQKAIQESVNGSTGKVKLTYLKSVLANYGWTASVNNNLLKYKTNNATTEYVVTENGRIEKATLTTEEVLEKLQIAQTEGIYQGEWEVIGIDGENLKYVSKESVTQISSRADTWSPQKDRERYINSVSILNTAAEEATGIIGAKSITVQDLCDILGEKNINQGTTNLYKFTYNKNKQVNIRTIYGGEFPNGEEIWANSLETTGGTTIIITETGESKRVGQNYDPEGTIEAVTGYGQEFTDEQLEKLQILNSTDSYWFATPIVVTDLIFKSDNNGQSTGEPLGNVAYCLPCFAEGNLMAYTWAQDDMTSSNGMLKGVRVVISL